MSGWIGMAAGVLAACATYLLLHEHPSRRAVGIVLFGIAINLLVFAMTGAEHSRAPLVSVGEEAPLAPFADPLPSVAVTVTVSSGSTAMSPRTWKSDVAVVWLAAIVTLFVAGGE